MGGPARDLGPVADPAGSARRRVGAGGALQHPVHLRRGHPPPPPLVGAQQDPAQTAHPRAGQRRGAQDRRPGNRPGPTRPWRSNRSARSPDGIRSHLFRTTASAAPGVANPPRDAQVLDRDPLDRVDHQEGDVGGLDRLLGPQQAVVLDPLRSDLAGGSPPCRRTAPGARRASRPCPPRPGWCRGGRGPPHDPRPPGG